MSTTDNQATERVCAHCGGPMEGKSAQARYCSRSCMDRARRQRQREAAGDRICIDCGQTFPRARKSKRCETCAAARTAKLAAERAMSITITEKRCNTCGETKPAGEFSRNRSARDGLQRSCKECQRIAAAENYKANREAILARRAELRQIPEVRERIWMVYARNRALRLGATVVEDVRRLDIFERDGWLCQLCGEPVEAPGREPRSATVDHATPLAEGGDHTYANCITAHYACNTAVKRHRDLAEHWARQWERVAGMPMDLGKAIIWHFLDPAGDLPDIDPTDINPDTLERTA